MADENIVVHVTHKMEEAARAERVIVMRDGEVAMDGSAAEVFTHPELPEWRLKPPVFTTLAGRLREHIPGLPEFCPDARTLASALGRVVRR